MMGDLAMPSQTALRYGLRTGRLLSIALAQGLRDAVSRNDESAADRYHRRLRMMAGQFDTNPAVSEALDRLLPVGEQWLATNVTQRHEAERQVLELIERLVELL
jgi:hypothetical protein